MIYFDNAATTYPKPKCVYDAVDFAMKNYSFNSGRGSYQLANNTYKMIEETREKIASLVSRRKECVVFTSSATESLNNIIYGMNLNENDTVFISPFEHNAIIRTLKNINVNIEIIPFDKNTWEIKRNDLFDMFVLKKPQITLISQISNVTGYMLPYENIFSIAKQFNCVTVLDAAQGFAEHQIKPSNIDFIVFAGHKSLNAMFGIAGYVNCSKRPLKLYKVGGTGSDSLNIEMPNDMPIRYEAGSLNSVGIYSIFSSIDFIKKQNNGIIKKEFVSYFLKKTEDNNNLIIYLPKNYISYGIISFNIKGYTSDEVGSILADNYDICVRTGYHCSPFVHDFIGSKDFLGTVRISFGYFNTTQEIDVLVNAIKKL